ncbi:MAG: LacI family DNA-binding transcriptional regulator [Flavobacteriaceae bacterium]|nr:LacI family DNA-binding transcriptional regulator [Flavobacteriaceae bacterium]
MKKKITLKDIANELSVSISTVSKALNDSFEISEETKKKIKEYAKQHNFKPNTLALSLQNQRSKTLGILIPNMLNHFFAQVFSGIEKVANNRGYKIITCITNDSYEKEVETMDLLANGSDIDGFILSMSKETEIKEQFQHFKDNIEDGIPIVMFDRVAEGVDVDKVIVNDEEGAYFATKHLINSNCKHIAFITTVAKYSIGKLRKEGYLRALKEALLPIDETMIVEVEDPKEYDEVIAQLFNKKKIDGILATNELSAITAMKIAQKKGMKIPKDLSVIGFSNGILSRHSTPKLTTVSQHGELMGETATHMLIDAIEKNNPAYASVTKVIKTTLVERESTKQLVKVKR